MESLIAIRRGIESDLRGIRKASEQAAADSWRRAWAMATEMGEEARETWEAVTLASDLDRHVEILRMELEEMKW